MTIHQTPANIVNGLWPFRTTRVAIETATPLVTIEDLRTELGLFDDTSMDAHVENYLFTAMERVSAEVASRWPAWPPKTGSPVSPTSSD